MSKKFVKNNEPFVCLNCFKYVDKHPTSSRDHCNFCLYSQHVDINPGDRKNECLGVLIPRGINNKNNKKKIIYECSKCHKQILNVVSPDDNEEILFPLYMFS